MISGIAEKSNRIVLLLFNENNREVVGVGGRPAGSLAQHCGYGCVAWHQHAGDVVVAQEVVPAGLGTIHLQV